MSSYAIDNEIREPVKPSRWSRKLTWAVTGLAGSAPSPIGTKLRSLLYKAIFVRIGSAVEVQPSVSFIDAGCVELSDRITISQGSCLEARGESRIILDSHVFLDRDVRISCGSGSGLVNLQAGVRCDRGVDIKVHGQGRTIVGKRTYIGPYSCLSGYGNITIGDDCLIASHTSLYAHNYNFRNPDQLIREQGYSHKGIVIENNCWIGSGVRILDGVTIGQGSIVGAGAVVTKDIPPNSIAVGTPAKVIGPRTEQTLSNCNEHKVHEARESSDRNRR